MDYFQMTAPCGLDCFNCPVHLAGENQDLKAAIARSLNIPVEEAVCKGCRNENGTVQFLNMSEPCNVYKCIEQKKIEFCCDCSDFPCDHLHPYADKGNEVPHNTKVFNLCLIKKMGLEAWAKDKAKSVKKTFFKKNGRSRALYSDGCYLTHPPLVGVRVNLWEDQGKHLSSLL